MASDVTKAEGITLSRSETEGTFISNAGQIHISIYFLTITVKGQRKASSLMQPTFLSFSLSLQKTI